MSPSRELNLDHEVNVALEGLPGSRRIERGLRDLREGRLSTAALLIAVAAQRLRGLGLRLPGNAALPAEPDLALYESLRGHPSGDSYFRYNALRQELDSFISCLEARRARAARDAAPAARSRRSDASPLE